jgi:hypothetical protein
MSIVFEPKRKKRLMIKTIGEWRETMPTFYETLRFKVEKCGHWELGSQEMRFSNG